MADRARPGLVAF